MNKENIPFYKNTDDQLHCMQMCLKSALEALRPSLTLSVDEMDQLAGFELGKLTWPMRAYVNVARLGYRVLIYDPMDFSRFIGDPDTYLREEMG